MNMREFNRRRSGPVRFSMDGDVFEAVPEIPASQMVDLIDRLQAAEADPADRFRQILEVLQRLLTPDSRGMFERRLSDPANPISVTQLTELTNWLVGEVYTERPTQPPSPSPEPPSDGGQPSTDGARPATSIPSTWAGPAI